MKRKFACAAVCLSAWVFFQPQAQGLQKPGDFWELTHPDPEHSNLYDVAYSPDDERLVAVGDGGAILVSDDNGEHWSLRPSPVVASLRSVTWTGSGFVAVGCQFSSNTVVLYSPTGDEWSSVFLEHPHDSPVVAGNHEKIIVPLSGGYILRPPTNGDPSTWDVSPVPDGPGSLAAAAALPGHLGGFLARGLCFTGSRFVVVGLGASVAVSENINPQSPDDWTVVSNDAVPIITSMAAARVLTGWSSGSWPMPIYASEFLLAGSGSGVLVAGTATGDWRVIEQNATSAPLNGIAWFPAEGTALDHNLAVAVGDNGTIITSENLADWTARSSGTTVPLRDVALATRRVFIPRPLPGHFEAAPYLVAVGSPDQPVFSGEENPVILASSDSGQTWSALEPPENAKGLLSIASNGSVLVAVGYGGTILRADLSETPFSDPAWTLVESGTRQAIDDVVWTGDQWVAVGGSIFQIPIPPATETDDGFVLTSPDGITWTRRSFPVSTDLYSVSTGVGAHADRLLVGGDHALIAVSDPRKGFADWLADQGVPENARGENDDPNHDGLPNLLCAALGIRPAGAPAHDQRSFLPRLIDPAPGKRMALGFHLNDASLADVELLVETSSTLEPGDRQTVLRLPLSGYPAWTDEGVSWTRSWQDITVYLPETLGEHPAAFARLRVESVP